MSSVLSLSDNTAQLIEIRGSSMRLYVFIGVYLPAFVRNYVHTDKFCAQISSPEGWQIMECNVWIALCAIFDGKFI